MIVLQPSGTTVGWDERRDSNVTNWWVYGYAYDDASEVLSSAMYDKQCSNENQVVSS